MWWSSVEAEKGWECIQAIVSRCLIQKRSRLGAWKGETRRKDFLKWGQRSCKLTEGKIKDAREGRKTELYSWEQEGMEAGCPYLWTLQFVIMTQKVNGTVTDVRAYRKSSNYSTCFVKQKARETYRGGSIARFEKRGKRHGHKERWTKRPRTTGHEVKGDKVVESWAEVRVRDTEKLWQSEVIVSLKSYWN